MHAGYSVPGLLLIACLIAQPTAARRLPPPGQLFHDVVMPEPSPAALAVAATRFDHSGTHTLDRLVVWRGSAAGWQSLDRRSGAGGGIGRWFDYTVRLAERELRTQLDSITRIAQIQQRPVVLDQANVVLVDGADSPSGPRVVRLLRIDPLSVVTEPRGHTVLQDDRKRSPEIVSFLNR